MPQLLKLLDRLFIALQQPQRRRSTHPADEDVEGADGDPRGLLAVRERQNELPCNTAKERDS